MRGRAGVVLIGASLLALTACQGVRGLTNFERAEDLGLGMDPTVPPSPPDRVNFTEAWMTKSDLLCRKYKDGLIAASIDTQLAAGLTAVVLGGLSTIFTPVNTVRSLAGAAAIATGLGKVVQADAFQSQAGQIIASAIQTARQNQANQIEINLRQADKDYSIYRAQRDVIEYHNMCSLETALVQVQASLRATAPDGGLSPPAKQGDQNSGGPAIAPKQNVSVATGKSAVVKVAPPVQSITGALKDSASMEPFLMQSDLRHIKEALCLKPGSGAVAFDSEFRDALRIYRESENNSNREAAGGLTPDEADKLTSSNPCPPQYMNAFEYYRYGTPDKIKRLQTGLNKFASAAGKPMDPPDGMFSPATRESIKAIQVQNKCRPQTGEITRKFIESIGDLTPFKTCGVVQ